jgi:hypothetical protein
MSMKEDQPPIFPRWSYWYALVLILLLAEIIFFLMISN